MPMATNFSESTFTYAQNMVSIFNDENYNFWSIQMKTLFISQDLWDLTDEGYEEPASSEVLSTWTTLISQREL